MPRRVTTYIALLFIVGVIASLSSLPTLHLDHLYIVIILWLAATILDIYDVELPNGTVFTGATIFTFVVLSIFGLAEAMVFELLVVITAAVYFKSSPIKTIFNVGQYLTSIAIAGAFYSHFGNTDNHGFSAFLLIVLTIGMKYLLNIAFLSVIMSEVSRKRYSVVFVEMITDAILPFIITSFFSLRLFSIHSQESMTQFWIEAAFIFIFFLSLRYSFRMFIKLRKTYLTTIESLTQLTEKRHFHSDGHAIRVGRIARKLAEEMKLPQDEIDLIHYAAIFHDLGKVQLKESILSKRGPLTIQEEIEYKRHVEYGANMIRGISGIEKAVEYVYLHHERWNGKGFPEGRQGEQTPLGARIIAAANEFDHLFSNQSTKAPATEFEKLSNHILDPQLVTLTLSLQNVLLESKDALTEISIEQQEVEEMVMSEARKQVYRSELLTKFGASVIATYDGASFRDENDREIDVPCRKKVLQLIEGSANPISRMRELVEDPVTKKIYDIYCFPVGTQAQLIYFDITHIIDYEKNQEIQVKSLYRDVIYAVTEGKLLLIEEQELDGLVPDNLMVHVPIKKKADVRICRESVENHLLSYPLSDKKRFDVMLCVSEVVTNVIKHAGEGEMKIFQMENVLRIVVQDQGSGIELSDIPKSTLLKGYSTKISLGQGFSLLVRFMDKIRMKTGPKGTTIVMDVHVH